MTGLAIRGALGVGHKSGAEGSLMGKSQITPATASNTYIKASSIKLLRQAAARWLSYNSKRYHQMDLKMHSQN